ncbi:MAG: LptF/LptG family permease [Candidatus Omnitrophica bacterium]|nr:LptF/LptG family permease [Candidatus Omnitrophota bacterium]
MKVLDRYLLRELFLPVLYCTLALLFLILISDLFNHLDDILRNQTRMTIVLRYYVSLVPFLLMQVLPWAAWLGTLFLLVNFGFHNEFTAMKVAGLKITTIIRPIFFLGFLLGIASFLISDRILPSTYRTAQDLREDFIEKKKDSTGQKVALQNITYSSSKNQLYFFRTFSPSRGMVEDVIVLWFDEEAQRTRQKTIASRGKWNGTTWEFDRVTEYQIDSRGQVLGEPRHFPKKIYPEIDVSPKELINAASESVFLSYRDLKQMIRNLQKNEVRVDSEKVDLHHRLAAPWQALVMMLTTIPLLGKTATRKVIAFNVLFCVAIVFAYHVIGAIGLALGKSGQFFPFLGAWIGNILFAAGAVATLEKANY